MNIPRLIQLLLLFGLLAFLYKLLWKKKDNPGTAPFGDSTEPMVKDPVCGTFIPKSQARIHEHKGEHLFFCSDKCKKEFLKKNR